MVCRTMRHCVTCFEGKRKLFVASRYLLNVATTKTVPPKLVTLNKVQIGITTRKGLAIACLSCCGALDNM
jgi:hypothetical protein